MLALLFAVGGVVGFWAAPSGAQECTDQLNIGLPQPLDPVMVTGDPAYERPGTGTTASPDLDIGLCGAFRSPAMNNDFANPPSDVRLAPNVVPDSINQFMDRAVGAPRVHANLTTPFDLANFIDDMGQNSYGDYITTAQCKPATPPGLTTWQGCGFPGSAGANLRLGFGSRFRGFLNVKAEWVGKQLHFGFYTDDILGVRIFWKIPGTNPVQYQVGWAISRGTAPGVSTFVTTNSVVFAKPGLYPIEIVHGSYGGAAILEFGILIQNDYVDREFTPLTVGGRIPMDDPRCRFTLTRTTPDVFFQSACGRFQYGDTPGSCEQCPAQFVEVPRMGRVYPAQYPCREGRFCNRSLVCSPCTEDIACGKDCEVCSGGTPRCAVAPEDPCNADKAKCCQCVTAKDCKAGQVCNGCQCVSPPCCAGYFAVFPDPTDPNYRLCSPCQEGDDAACQAKGLGNFCDAKNARCTNTPAPSCLKDGLSVHEQCGPACNINCRTQTPDRPYCLNNQVCVACRRDADCPSGNYCLSGTCTNPCTDDRHCGSSCQNCGIALDPKQPGQPGNPTNEPYCKVETVNGQKVVSTAVCVQCREDKECAPGQTCVDNRCTPDQPCGAACQNNEVCYGGKCVQCFNDAQCPCGHCVDGRCSDKCASNQDCEGNQCCQKTTGLCVSGKCGGMAGGALCGCSLTGVAPAASSPLEPEPFDPPGESGPASRSLGLSLAALAALAFGLSLRRRNRLTTRLP